MANRQFRTVLTILFIFWILIALSRTIFNFSKLFTEEKEWYFLTDEQKKEKQFGEMHLFFRFAQKDIPSGSNILLYTQNGMAYYLARYYFYPTTVIWGERQFTEWGNDINRNYSYVLYFLPINKATRQITVNHVVYKKMDEFKYGDIIAGEIYKK